MSAAGPPSEWAEDVLLRALARVESGSLAAASRYRERPVGGAARGARRRGRPRRAALRKCRRRASRSRRCPPARVRAGGGRGGEPAVRRPGRSRAWPPGRGAGVSARQAVTCPKCIEPTTTPRRAA